MQLIPNTPDEYKALAREWLAIERAMGEGFDNEYALANSKDRQREVEQAMDASGFEFDEDDNVIRPGETPCN